MEGKPSVSGYLEIASQLQEAAYRAGFNAGIRKMVEWVETHKSVRSDGELYFVNLFDQDWQAFKKSKGVA